MNAGYVTLPVAIYLAELLWQLLLGFLIALLLARIVFARERKRSQHQSGQQGDIRGTQQEIHELLLQIERLQCLGCWQMNNPSTPYPTHWTVTFCQRCSDLSQEEHYNTQPSIQVQQEEHIQDLMCAC